MITGGLELTGSTEDSSRRLNSQHPQRWLTIACNSNSRGSDNLLCHPQAPTNRPIHKINNELFLKMLNGSLWECLIRICVSSDTQGVDAMLGILE